MSNIIRAIFNNVNDKEVFAKARYQYDYGMVLRFEGAVTLPSAFEVHFALEKHGEAITQIGDPEGVPVPDALFLAGKTIYAWAYLHSGEDDGYTEYMVQIPVIKRAQPSDEVPTPVQQSAIDQAIAALGVAVEQTAADVETTTEKAAEAQASAEAAAASAAEAAETAENVEENVTAARAAKAAAEAARDRAVQAETSAGQSKTAAATSEANAAASATAASASASAALTSEENANGAMMSAYSDANRADTAADTATSAKNDAVSAKTAAQSAKTAAETAASTATTKATAAANSATAAAGSATAAANSATNAAASAQSVASSAAQITTNSEDIASLKEDLSNVNNLSIIDLTIKSVWEIGSISGSGVPTVNNAAIRTKDFIDVSDFSEIDFKIVSGYSFGWHFYNAYKTNTTNAASYISTNLLLSVPKEAKYLKINMIKTNDQNADVTWSANLQALSETFLKKNITALNADLTTIGTVNFVEMDGFIGADGSIGSSTSDEAKYTSKINVKSGDVVSIHMTLPQDKSMWMAYATYNTSDVFVERVVFISNVTDRVFDYSVTISANISAISFTYRTYGISTTTIQRYSPLADLYTSVPSASVSGIMQNAGEHYEAELGTIYLGIDNGSDTRCRTKGFIPMHGGVVIPSGYPFGIQYYDADKKYITSDPSWNQAEKKVEVESTRYIRLTMRKPDNSVIATDDVETIAKSFTIIRELNGSCFIDPPELPSYFSDEVIDCRDKLESYCTEKALVFALVTDSHIYNYSDKKSKGWWKDTIRNIKAVNSVYQLDALVHMGDMVNGSLPKAETIDLIRETRDDLRSVLEPNFILVGNHDDNSFTSYPITEAEMYALFCRYNEKDVTNRPTNKLYWYKDYNSLGIRVVFLSSHLGDGLDGQTSETWGYPQDEVTWFINEALDTDKQILMLSHMPFTQGYISGNSNLPTNGNLMIQAVNTFIGNGGVVIGLINGHTHFDYINDNGSFHEISQGGELNTTNTSDKTGTSIASFVPESAIQYGRTERTLTQDLWNILVVRPTSRTCKLIRFGAGVDVTWTY